MQIWCIQTLPICDAPGDYSLEYPICAILIETKPLSFSVFIHYSLMHLLLLYWQLDWKKVKT